MSVKLTLEDVHVSFPIVGAEARSLKRAALVGVLNITKGRQRKVGGQLSTTESTTVVNALKGISLELETGARVALVGHNGAGKTTLLRVMAGIYPPNRGKVSTIGRVTTLLDIGSGVDLGATGRENVFLRALYMGRTYDETNEVIDEILEFSELGTFADMPVRTYSAGMLTRLLFATATAFPADILLLDEGIGAGDAAFAERAETRMQSFVDQAGILVLATHDDNLIKKFCTEFIKLESGEFLERGWF